eukprot:GHVN01080909.1.p2 GENE.GHVN01080909.1~~GHVN01080909.1.p2  ORF type:complete len:123 (+),score=6.58 GHVN01080909.1:112-480(+)
MSRNLLQFFSGPQRDQPVSKANWENTHGANSRGMSMQNFQQHVWPNQAPREPKPFQQTQSQPLEPTAEWRRERAHKIRVDGAGFKDLGLENLTEDIQGRIIGSPGGSRYTRCVYCKSQHLFR